MKAKRRFINPIDHETAVSIPFTRAELIQIQNILIAKAERDKDAGEVVLPLADLTKKIEYYLSGR